MQWNQLTLPLLIMSTSRTEAISSLFFQWVMERSTIRSIKGSREVKEIARTPSAGCLLFTERQMNSETRCMFVKRSKKFAMVCKTWSTPLFAATMAWHTLLLPFTMVNLNPTPATRSTTESQSVTDGRTKKSTERMQRILAALQLT